MKITYLAALLLFFYVLIHPQENPKPVAVVGNKSISADEFQFRYELTPQLFREQEGTGSALKLEFLYTLIAEKLLASYGEEIQLDTSEVVKHALKSFEEMFVRDELYRQVIAEKAKIKSDSLFGFYAVNSTKALLKYIRTNNFNEAERIHKLLQKGTPFDFFFSDTTLSLQDTLIITFGQFDELTENEILTLPENAFSKPLPFNDQWVILSVIKKFYPLIERTPGWESEYRRLKKLAKERAEYSFYKNYIHKKFNSLNVRANGKLLKLFAGEVLELLEKKKLKIGEQKKYYLEVSDIALLNNKMGEDNLNAAYFDISGKAISLRDFINYFRFESTSFDSLNFQNILDRLNGKTRKFIEYKFLANEGYGMGLEKLPQVQKEFNMWKQNYLYQLVVAEFSDTIEVSEEEVKTYYNQLNRNRIRIKEANVFEIIVRTPESAEYVLNKLEAGTDIAGLCNNISVDKNFDWKCNESGFKPITNFSEISSVLEKMKIGETFGPMKISEGYSIFRLINIREDSSFNPTAFELTKQELTEELRHVKAKQSMNQFIANLAKLNKININNDLLNTISTTIHNSLVFKLLGFGGKITAVPLITPNAEWVQEWLNSLKINP